MPAAVATPPSTAYDTPDGEIYNRCRQEEEVMDWAPEPEGTIAEQCPEKKIIDGPITTIMLRNLRVHLTRPVLLKKLDTLGFKGTYDFVHMPMNFGSTMNKRLAFINFVDEASASRFVASLPTTGRDSGWQALPADVQGLEANVEAASSHKVARIRNKVNKPLLLVSKTPVAPAPTQKEAPVLALPKAETPALGPPPTLWRRHMVPPSPPPPTPPVMGAAAPQHWARAPGPPPAEPPSATPLRLGPWRRHVRLAMEAAAHRSLQQPCH